MVRITLIIKFTYLLSCSSLCVCVPLCMFEYNYVLCVWDVAAQCIYAQCTVCLYILLEHGFTDNIQTVIKISMFSLLLYVQAHLSTGWTWCWCWLEMFAGIVWCHHVIWKRGGCSFLSQGLFLLLLSTHPRLWNEDSVPIGWGPYWHVS